MLKKKNILLTMLELSDKLEIHLESIPRRGM